MKTRIKLPMQLESQTAIEFLSDFSEEDRSSNQIDNCANFPKKKRKSSFTSK
jgi:hypothetical protein